MRNLRANQVFCVESLGLSDDGIQIVLQASKVGPGADQLHPALLEHLEELRSWHTIRGSALDRAKAEFACLIDLRASICPRIEPQERHLPLERTLEGGAGHGRSLRGCWYAVLELA